MAFSREDYLIRRPTRKDQGVAGPPRSEEPVRWNWSIGRRRYEWRPLDDAIYTARFHLLCFHYHPAVAAVMAHDVAAGPGCMDRRGAPRRGGAAPANPSAEGSTTAGVDCNAEGS